MIKVICTLILILDGSVSSFRAMGTLVGAEQGDHRTSQQQDMATPLWYVDFTEFLNAKRLDTGKTVYYVNGNSCVFVGGLK